MTRATYTSDHQRLGAPKKMTYAVKFCLLDGDDGKTYIASWHGPRHPWVIIHEGRAPRWWRLRGRGR